MKDPLDQVSDPFARARETCITPFVMLSTSGALKAEGAEFTDGHCVVRVAADRSTLTFPDRATLRDAFPKLVIVEDYGG